MLCASLILGAHLATYHFDRVGYNELNIGPYVQCDSIVAGAYYNSERNVSFYIGKQYSYLTIGLVSGYKRNVVVPLIVPSIKLNDTFRLSFVPPIKGISGAIHFSIEKELK